MAAAPEQVKTVVLQKFGGCETLKISEMPLAVPKPGEVEVTVHFCGLNFADVYTRCGLMQGRKPPFPLGIECSGVVTKIGTPDSGDNRESSPFKVGDHVVCYDLSTGLHREKVIVDEHKCYLLPEGISLKIGAALFVNYMTAYFTVIEMGNLKSGQTVLIHSCAGGVGWAATQLVHLKENVKVFGTASATKHEEVRKNGVAHPLTYETFAEVVREISPLGVDLVLDNQAAGPTANSRELLKPLGKIIVIGANNLINSNEKVSMVTMLKAWWTAKDAPMGELIHKSRLVGGFHLGTLADADVQVVRNAFTNICQLVIEGKLTPRIDSVWPFEKVMEATEVIGGRKNIGKVLLSLGRE